MRIVVCVSIIPLLVYVTNITCFRSYSMRQEGIVATNNNGIDEKLYNFSFFLDCHFLIIYIALHIY